MPSSLRHLRAWQVAAALCAAILVILASGARAATGPLMRPGDAEAGTLLLRSAEPGRYLPAPTVATDVEIDVSGVVARTIVRQRFHNPSDQWVEGVYVFPLPERAAVDTLRMQIGERFIEGRIDERQAARAAYEQALRDGRRAGLVEQERPNLFTNSVANIGPDETVTIEIQYQERLVPDDGRFALRFPMVVAPRYIPGSNGLQTVGATGTGLSADTGAVRPGRTAPLDEDGRAVAHPSVPDASRITPPVPRPEDAPRNKVHIRLTLAAGLPVSDIESPYHPVSIDTTDPDRLAIALVEGGTLANRDFVLRWRAGEQDRPAATTLLEDAAQGRYALVLIAPPTLPAPEAALPRETIFVIDVSGSMSGTSIVQAKAALRLALADLSPADRFNVIAFSNTAMPLFADAAPAAPDNLARAESFIDRLNADGGTEMSQALQLALPTRQAGDRLRQVVFITDGAVGNEAQLFEMVEQRRGDSRLFTVGIGAAPNSHFMRGAATAGRGTFTHIGDVGEVQHEMRRLLDKLKRPVLTDLKVTVDGKDPAEAYPWPLPDLYAGEPVALALKLPAGVSRIGVAGRAGDRPWQAEVALADAGPGKGLARLWAREKIAALEAARLTGVPADAVDAGVLRTALDHGLVSRLTSLVAVDVTPTRPRGQPVDTRNLPLDLPAGWNWDKVFGKPVAPAQREAMRQLQRVQVATAEVTLADAAPRPAPGMTAGTAAAPAAPPPAQPIGLPQTATPAPLHQFLGVLLLMLAAAAWWFTRRLGAP